MTAEGIEPLLEVRGLAKRFGAHEVVRQVDLDVRPGECYGFLGRNGAGKTTTLRLILGLIPRDAGMVRLRGTVGALVESPGFYPNLDARHNLELFTVKGGFPGAIEGLLEYVGLGSVGTKPFRQYSLGMKQRLGIARTLVNDPDLVILDEPVNGLDPAGIREVRDLIRSLVKDRGKAVLVSSHLLAEVELIADSLGILHNGTLVDQLTLADFRARHRPFWDLEVDDVVKAREILGTFSGIGPTEVLAPHRLRIFGNDVPSAEINRKLVLGGVAVSSIALSGKTLEDHFLEVTGGSHG